MENNLAENIRTFRKERKMTQEQLAEALGVTVGTIHKWERSLSTPEIGLIMDMAELFGTSTDVLLGYKWRTTSLAGTLGRIRALMQEKRYEQAVSEAEKALKRFPNHFELVYCGAMAYMKMSSGFDSQNGAAGITPAQKKAYDRGVALFEQACALFPQNTDESISEVSVRRNMAALHENCMYIDRAIEVLKQCNVCGINNARIGMLYDNYMHDPAQAGPYLAEAFGTLMNDTDAVFLGLADMFYRRKDYDRAIDCLELLRKILCGIRSEGTLTVFDRYDVWLLRTIAEMYCFQGDFAQAKACLKEALEKALRYDAAAPGAIREMRLYAALGIRNMP
ncbi:MAG: helix-turn-helix domain-containing protein, partial [Hominenteromicrobium sp.]